ncbi:MAG: hypothetical protein RMK64_10430 [Rhodovarius sp.]|nr:hypothetical protein [Rhodovarius sp.]MCX7932586.1 hypothetical protein [Rhodovarius sp.]MDW8315376.1 hypothetical protein [Rhodovarius sp.]
MDPDPDFGFSAPGAEDRANAAAALASALVREAAALAQAAAGLSACLPGPAGPGALSDVRRARSVAAAAAEAATRAALLLEAAEVIGAMPEDAAERLARAAERNGLPPASLRPALRAAALALPTDDGAARIAAGILAADLGLALGG